MSDVTYTQQYLFEELEAENALNRVNKELSARESHAPRDIPTLHTDAFVNRPELPESYSSSFIADLVVPVSFSGIRSRCEKTSSLKFLELKLSADAAGTVASAMQSGLFFNDADYLLGVIKGALKGCDQAVVNAVRDWFGEFKASMEKDPKRCIAEGGYLPSTAWKMYHSIRLYGADAVVSSDGR
jgi:hypothetical protein